jgi:hypothetical protein
MKIAILMVTTAISLFAGTVIWSARTPVERTIINKGNSVYSVPDRKTTHSWYYQSEHAQIFNVNAPVHVELDDSFYGVELLGDTSFFKYFTIQINKNPLLRASINISTVTATIPARNVYTHQVFVPSSVTDSINNQLLNAANITIRIGIGSGSTDGERQFAFSACKTVTSMTPITEGRILIEAYDADSLAFHLQVKNFELYSETSLKNPVKHVAKLTGKTDQAHYRITGIDLQAHDLISKESYLLQCKDSNIDIFATEIANAREMVNCPLKISGNPPYQRIIERQQ